MNALPRRLEPEWLDTLPPEDRGAVGSRNDLRRLNVLMLNQSIIARALMRSAGAGQPRRILEIGAGDGTFMLSLARRLSRSWPSVEVTLVDRQAIVTAETKRGFEAAGWTAHTISADVFDYLAPSVSFDLVIANLFLHHFDTEHLARLFAHLARVTRLFTACEPRRAWLPINASRMLWAIGCNCVTRHDALVSARAGFRDRELSALWPKEGWELSENPAGLFSHCFVARHG